MLIEMVVLTNRHDEEFVLSKSGAEALASAITKATEAAVPRR